MRLCFMGTPDFSVPVLAELIAAGHQIVAVYSQPPRKSGRGQRETPSPVHEFAQTHGIEVRTPINFKQSEQRAAFAALDLDVAIVVAYGLILPQEILDAPKYGCLNLHGSLLPRWRGAAPINRAIMAGDEMTGVQVMQMEAGLDTGPVLLSETVAIKPNDTAGSLHDRLSRVGADLMPRALAALSRGALNPQQQSGEGVTYAHKLTPEETRIKWSRCAHDLDCHIRGLSPFPGAWFEAPDKNGKPVRIKALLSQIVDGAGVAGTVLASDEALIVACADGAVAISRLQRAGRGPQQADEMLRGFAIPAGTVLR